MSNEAETAAYKRKAAREREARRAAERLLEAKAAELFDLNASLEQQVVERTRELAATRDAAIAASHAKGEFLARMSHEIRTPMNAVIGMAEYLLLCQPPDEIGEGLRTISSAGESLLALINDILDFSKIESGSLKLQPVDFNLVAQIRSVVDLLRLTAETKGIEICADIDERLRGIFRGDETRFRQVLVNLAGNAVKFTNQGSVTIRARLVKVRGAELEVECSVADTGPGIPSDQQEAIFESFEQVDGSSTRTHGGTGLGLAISRQLVHMFGGDLSVTSELGRGSTFTFSAWIERCAFEEVEQLPPMNIVALGSDEDSASVVTALGEGNGHVSLASNDLEATQALVEAARRRERIHAAVVCVRDEFAAVNLGGALAALPSLSEVQIAIVGPGAKMGDLPIALRSRAVCIPGELTEEAMSEALHALADRAKPFRATTPTSEPARESVRILVVDDNAANRKVAVGLLEQAGYSAESAADGREALSAVTAGDFALVLMDVQMPRMTGIEATKHIRAWEVERGGHLPIIGFSAATRADDALSCTRAGMDGYLTKPVRPKELFETVAEMLGKAERARTPVVPPSEQESFEARIASADVVDALGDDPDFARTLLAVLVEDAELALRRLAHPIGDDAKEVAGLAHQLKGSVATIIRPELGISAKGLEDAIADDDREAEARRKALHHILGNIVGEIKEFLGAEAA